MTRLLTILMKYQSLFFFRKLRKMSQNLSSAAVVIDVLRVKLMNNDIQPNTNDCDVYAIAFCASLAVCKEPAYLHHNSKMRSHLLKCLHNGVLTEFPSKPEQRKSIFIRAHMVPLYCQRTILCSNAQNVNVGSNQNAKR